MSFSWQSPRLLYHLSGCCRGGLQRGYKCEDGRHASIGTLKTFHEDVKFFMVGIFGDFFCLELCSWGGRIPLLCGFSCSLCRFRKLFQSHQRLQCDESTGNSEACPSMTSRVEGNMINKSWDDWQVPGFHDFGTGLMYFERLSKHLSNHYQHHHES